jgi:hypothetical protein
MSKADVELTMNTTPEDQVWASRAEVDEALQGATWNRTLELKGLTFERGTFGGWTKARAQEAA